MQCSPIIQQVADRIRQRDPAEQIILYSDHHAVTGEHTPF